MASYWVDITDAGTVGGKQINKVVFLPTDHHSCRMVNERTSMVDNSRIKENSGCSLVTTVLADGSH